MLKVDDEVLSDFLSSCSIHHARFKNGQVRELCIEKVGKAFVLRMENGNTTFLRPEFQLMKVSRSSRSGVSRDYRAAVFFQEELEGHMNNFGFKEDKILEWVQKLMDNPLERFYNSDHTFYITGIPDEERKFKDFNVV